MMSRSLLSIVIIAICHLYPETSIDAILQRRFPYADKGSISVSDSDMSFLPDNEGLSNFEVAELDKEIRDVVGIVESQIQKLEILVLLRKKLVYANRQTLKEEGDIEINGYSIINENSDLEVESDIDLIYQKIKRYNLASNVAQNITTNTKEEEGRKKVNEKRKERKEYEDSLGILRDHLDKVLHIRTNHAVDIVKLMRFDTRNSNTAIVRRSKAKEKDVPSIESAAHKKRDLSVSGLANERAKEAERKKNGGNGPFFSFLSRTARREVNSREAACNAAVHLVIAIDTHNVLHIYDAMPQTSCPPSNMTEKIGRHEDCDHGSGREDDGVELLVQPLLHPKGSIVTAISYYGTDDDCPVLVTAASDGSVHMTYLQIYRYGVLVAGKATHQQSASTISSSNTMHIAHPEEKEEGKEGGREEEEEKTSAIENRPISITVSGVLSSYSLLTQSVPSSSSSSHSSSSSPSSPTSNPSHESKEENKINDSLYQSGNMRAFGTSLKCATYGGSSRQKDFFVLYIGDSTGCLHKLLVPTNRSATKSFSRRILHLSLLSSQPEESANGTEELAVKSVETLDLSSHYASEARAAQCSNSGCGRSNIDTYQNKGNSNVRIDFEGPPNDESSMSTLSVTDIAESKSMKLLAAAAGLSVWLLRSNTIPGKFQTLNYHCTHNSNDTEDSGTDYFVQIAFDVKSPTLLVAVKKSGSVVIFDTMVAKGMKKTICAVIASYPVAHALSSTSISLPVTSSSHLCQTVDMSLRQQTVDNSNEQTVPDDVTHDTRRLHNRESDHSERGSIFSSTVTYTPEPMEPSVGVRTFSCSISGYTAVSNQCTLLLYKISSAFSRQKREKKRSIAEASSSLTAVVESVSNFTFSSRLCNNSKSSWNQQLIDSISAPRLTSRYRTPASGIYSRDLFVLVMNTDSGEKEMHTSGATIVVYSSKLESKSHERKKGNFISRVKFSVLVIGVAVICVWNVCLGGRRSRSFSERFLSTFAISDEDSRPSRLRWQHSYSKSAENSDEIYEDNIHNDDIQQLSTAMGSDDYVTRGTRDMPLIDEYSERKASNTPREIRGDIKRTEDADRILENRRGLKNTIEREGYREENQIKDNQSFRSRRATKFSRSGITKNFTSVGKMASERERKISYSDEFVLRARIKDRDFDD